MTAAARSRSMKALACGMEQMRLGSPAPFGGVAHDRVVGGLVEVYRCVAGAVASELLAERSEMVTGSPFEIAVDEVVVEVLDRCVLEFAGRGVCCRVAGVVAVEQRLDRYGVCLFGLLDVVEDR